MLPGLVHSPTLDLSAASRARRQNTRTASVANVDTPGEQQKYGIALVEHLVSLLPPTATLAVFYDIGCVLDRSLHLVRARYPFIGSSVS